MSGKWCVFDGGSSSYTFLSQLFYLFHILLVFSVCKLKFDFLYKCIYFFGLARTLVPPLKCDKNLV